jgi:hypothetical protein
MTGLHKVQKCLANGKGVYISTVGTVVVQKQKCLANGKGVYISTVGTVVVQKQKFFTVNIAKS